MSTATARPGSEPPPTIESPFLNEVAAPLPSPGGSIREFAGLASPFRDESPFLRGYGDPELDVSPEDQLLAELEAEMEDASFRDALRRFQQEAVGIHDAVGGAYVEGETGLEYDGRTAFESLAPRIRAVESVLDRVASEFAGRTVIETELDEIDRAFGKHAAAFSGDQFEYFFGGLVKKAAKAVKGVVKTAQNAVKTGLKVVGKVLPIGQLLDGLKKLVRPLIERVLSAAIDRLPAPVRPAAKQLAKKFAGLAKELEFESADGDDAAELESEFDAYIASAALREPSAHREPPVEGFFGVRSLRPSKLRDLRLARARAVRGIAAARDSESAAAHVEQFIPAVIAAAPVALTVAKTAIGILGRERVKSSLASLVAGLIKQHIGPQMAAPLSSAIVDTGMGLLGLEVPAEARPQAFAEMVAQLAEDTTERFAEAVESSGLPAPLVENEHVMRALAAEAFEAALAANLPQQELRPELQETSIEPGQWLLLPATGTKYYKKFSRVREVSIDPKTAGSIRSFGGDSLGEFLFGRRGYPAGGRLKARVHLYEAIPGTWLSRITLHERTTPGLGSAAEAAWSQIHPLTTAAAGALLGAAGLGRDVGEQWLQSRHKVAPGQRFYYLEIVGTDEGTPRPVPASPASDSRPTQFNIVIDCVRGELRIHLHLSEPAAQRLAAAMRDGANKEAAIRILLTLVAAAANSLVEGLESHVRIIRRQERLAPAAGAAAVMLRRLLVRWLLARVRQWITQAVIKWANENWQLAAEAIRHAADDDAAGITITSAAQQVQAVETLARLIEGRLPSIPDSFETPSFRVGVRPGFHRD